MSFIPLTQGKFAVVDESDVKMLSEWSWCVNAYGYARRAYRVGGKLTEMWMHRYILGAEPGKDVDHINGDKLDNRRCNLRICTRSQNLMNKRVSNSHTSRYKGVFWEKRHKRWVAKISCAGKQHYLGEYKDEWDAACSYNAKALELFGEFSRLNVKDV